MKSLFQALYFNFPFDSLSFDSLNVIFVQFVEIGVNFFECLFLLLVKIQEVVCVNFLYTCCFFQLGRLVIYHDHF